jgi:hypothetical protein
MDVTTKKMIPCAICHVAVDFPIQAVIPLVFVVAPGLTPSLRSEDPAHVIKQMINNLPILILSTNL